ncbi:sensor histidine kinase [Dyella silvae]|uniref:sensor histidine kinase n=1 Tax=Dyella silvae TaxID=2994424 RepID=UPI002264D8BD|nr:histidine kinase [Dyella silvae]
MRGSITEPPAPQRAEHHQLPDFCSGTVIFALLVTAGITVTVMWLAPNNSHGWRGYSVGMLFAVWLALVIGLALCKLRPLLQRLPGNASYGGVWLVMVLIVGGGSAMVYWMDQAMQMALLTDTAGDFVLNNIAIAALLGAAMLRYFYLLAQWQTRLAAVSKAQVAALQARIRPHFLFNSMNTVAALVRVDPDAAERTVEDLSELFRAALGEHSTQDGTLGEEVTLVDRYLAIEQLRLGPRLRVHREWDELPLAFPLPRLLLQPLVENAVRHGIQPLREGGDVILRGWRERDGVIIEIDNPRGGEPSQGGHGHGLGSVRQRVAYRYGPRAEVLAGPMGDRFVVRLQLPEQAGSIDARIDR